MTAPAVDHDRTLIDWITVTHDDRGHLAWALRGPVEKRNGLHAYWTAVQAPSCYRGDPCQSCPQVTHCCALGVRSNASQ